MVEHVQMGFSASEVYDALSQVENPLMGQFLNFVAMLIFLQNRWFATLFAGALETSFKSLNVFSIIESGNTIALFMTRGLTLLFRDALVIALPIMATLFLINVTMGILSKAAPQMNLLSEGFPILILTAFYIMRKLTFSGLPQKMKGAQRNLQSINSARHVKRGVLQKVRNLTELLFIFLQLLF